MLKLKSSLTVALTLFPSLALVGCSSTSSTTPETPADAGVTPEASVDAAAAVDSGPAPVPEPKWSGTTIEPGCTVNGCIHAFAQSGHYTQKILAPEAASGNTVTNGYVSYSITYVSDGKEVTGSVYVPDSTPPTAGFGVMVMNQFTSGVGASCAPSLGTLSLGIASTTALNGIVTIVPDATSFGTAPYGAYLDGPIAAHAALDAARAAFHTSQALGKPIARKAVIGGLSQGAYSTMAAATAYPVYANQLEIRGFVAAEPPSDLRTTGNAAITSGPGPFVYDAMRLWSWQGLHSLSGGAIFNPPYDTQAPAWFAADCIYNGVDGSSGALYNLFYEPYPDGGTPTTPIAASALFTQTFLDYAKNDTWPADWSAAYAASLTVPTGLKLPVLVFEGDADVTVLPADADAYVAKLKAAGVNVDYRKIHGGTHGTTALSSFTVGQLANDQALAWINSTLAN